MRKRFVTVFAILLLSLLPSQSVTATHTLGWENAVPAVLGENLVTLDGDQERYWMYFDANRSKGYSFSLSAPSNIYLELGLNWYTGEYLEFIDWAGGDIYPIIIETSGYYRYYITVSNYFVATDFRLVIEEFEPEPGSRAKPFEIPMGQTVVDFIGCCDKQFFKFENTSYEYIQISRDIIGDDRDYWLDFYVYDKNDKRIKNYWMSSWDDQENRRDFVLDTIRAPFLIEIVGDSNYQDTQLQITISNTTVEPGTFRSNAVPLSYNESVNANLAREMTWYTNISTVTGNWYYLQLEITDYELEPYFRYELMNGSDFTFYHEWTDSEADLYFIGDGSNFTFELRSDYSSVFVNISLIEKVPPPGYTYLNPIEVLFGSNEYSINSSSELYLTFSGESNQYYQLELDPFNSISGDDIHMEVFSDAGDNVGHTYNSGDGYPKSVYVNGYEKYLIMVRNDYWLDRDFNVTVYDFNPPTGFDVSHADSMAHDGVASVIPFQSDHPYVFNVSTVEGQVYWFELSGIEENSGFWIDFFDHNYNNLWWNSRLRVEYRENKRFGIFVGTGNTVIVHVYPGWQVQAYALSLVPMASDVDISSSLSRSYNQNLENDMIFQYKSSRKWNGESAWHGNPPFQNGDTIDVTIHNVRESTYYEDYFDQIGYYSDDMYQVMLGGDPIWESFNRHFIHPESLIVYTSDTQYQMEGIEMYQFLFPGYTVSQDEEDDSITRVYREQQLDDIYVYEEFQYHNEFGNLVFYQYLIEENLLGNTEEMSIVLFNTYIPFETTEPGLTEGETTSPLYVIPVLVAPIFSAMILIVILTRRKRIS